MGHISATKMRADVAEAIAAGSDASLLFSGLTIPVWISQVNKSDDLDDDTGILNEAEVEAVGVITDFTTKPQVRDTVYLTEAAVADPVQYYIERITRDESAIHLFLQVEKW